MSNQFRHLRVCCGAQTGRLSLDSGWPGRTQRDRFMDQVALLRSPARSASQTVQVVSLFQLQLRPAWHRPGLPDVCITTRRLAASGRLRHRSPRQPPRSACGAGFDFRVGKILKTDIGMQRRADAGGGMPLASLVRYRFTDPKTSASMGCALSEMLPFMLSAVA